MNKQRCIITIFLVMILCAGVMVSGCSGGDAARPSNQDNAGSEAAVQNLVGYMIFDDELLNEYRNDENFAISESGLFYYDINSDTAYLGAYVYCQDAPKYLGSDACPGYTEENVCKNVVLVMHNAGDKITSKEAAEKQAGEMYWMHDEYEQALLFGSSWLEGTTGQVSFERVLSDAGIPEGFVAFVEI